VNVVVGGYWVWESEGDGGGGGGDGEDGGDEEAVLVVQDGGQEVKNRGPVESCKKECVLTNKLGRWSINIDLYQIFGHLAVLFGCMMPCVWAKVL